MNRREQQEELTNYQARLMEKNCQGLIHSGRSQGTKYSLWDLDFKISRVCKAKIQSVRWVGNHATAYLEAFGYAMITAFIRSKRLIQLKHLLYPLARDSLQLMQQRLLVQFICMVDLSRDKSVSLRRYPQIEQALVLALTFVERRLNASSALENDLDPYYRRRAYKALSIWCQPLVVRSLTDDCLTLSLSGQTFHIVIEKECYFVVQEQSQSPLQTGPLFASDKSQLFNISDSITINRQKQWQSTTITQSNHPIEKFSPRKQNHTNTHQSKQKSSVNNNSICAITRRNSDVIVKLNLFKGPSKHHMDTTLNTPKGTSSNGFNISDIQKDVHRGQNSQGLLQSIKEAANKGNLSQHTKIPHFILSRQKQLQSQQNFTGSDQNTSTTPSSANHGVQNMSIQTPQESPIKLLVSVQQSSKDYISSAEVLNHSHLVRRKAV